MTTDPSPFTLYRGELARQLLESEVIHTGSWQRINTSGSAAHATYELTDVTVRLQVPSGRPALQALVQPDLPWAETHFGERVSGVPMNPAPSHEIWPYAVKGNGQHIDGGKFAHTYPERFWPKHAEGEQDCHGPYDFTVQPVDEYGRAPDGRQMCKGRMGVRFHYGDLDDVINLLVRERLTRQAFLPIWFPEDTGVTDNQRVPCTLGYHFLVRNDFLSMRYYMRSCDIYRHFTNDVYMAARLMQHVIQQVNLRVGFDQDPIMPAQLIMYISSLHGFVGDKDKLEAML